MRLLIYISYLFNFYKLSDLLTAWCISTGYKS